MRRLISTVRQVSRICETLLKDLWDGLSALWDRSAGSDGRFVRIYETAYQHLWEVRRINETTPKDLWDGLSAPMRQVSRIRETLHQELLDGLSASMRQISRICETLLKDLWDGLSGQQDSMRRFLRIYETAYQHYETGQQDLWDAS